MMADQGLHIKISVDVRQGVAAVGELARAFGQLAAQAGRTHQSIKTLTVAVAAGQAAFTFVAQSLRTVFIELPRALAQAAIAAERLDRAFGVLTGSQQAATAEQRFVREEAQRLGIGLSDAQSAYLKLTAAARGTALEGEGARKIFSAVAGAASTLGLSAAETSNALLAISQMMSKGTVQAEELRGQLGERIPGAFQIAARAMGVATAELSAMLDQGELLADDFLPRFAAQLAREIPASADTLGAVFNRLGNAIHEALSLIGSALAETLDEMHGIKRASEALRDSDAIVEFARLGAKAVAALVDVLRELVLLVPNVMATVGGSIAAVARDIQFAVEVATIALTLGIGERGRAAMREALEERNRFIEAFNADMVERWFPKQLAERVDDFFARLRQKMAQAQLAQGGGARGVTPDKLTRLPAIIKPFEADLRALQAALKAQAEIIDTALAARLIKVEDYWRAKAAIDERALEAERERLARGLAAQQALIARLAAAKPRDANQRAELAEKLNEARSKAADLRAELDALDGRKIAAEFRLRVDRERALAEIRDAVEEARLAIAQAQGTDTPEMRRAAIERALRDTVGRLAQDAEGARLAQRLIDIRAAEAELAALQARWHLALETMRNAEQSAAIQREQGLITTAQAQQAIAAAHAQAAAEIERLLPLMERAAQALGPEAVARVQAWRNELASVRNVVDPLAAAIGTQIKDAFASMFEAVGTGAKSARDAFGDFVRSVIAGINRIAAQKLAESIFGAMGGGGAGGWIAGALKFFGFAAGGPVPGTGTRDSVPALLTPGEYVIRRDVAQRLGRGLLDAINGGAWLPRIDAGRLAFASGGMVPQVAQPSVSQSVRVVNVVDPSMAADWMDSPAGERVLLNVIGRNATAVRTLLAGA
jgi:tape measure domain-containing protein